MFSNGQTQVDYMIGLRTGDIGDYAQPSERFYTQIFNETNLPTLVYTRYVPKFNQQGLATNSSFYYRTEPLNGVNDHFPKNS